MSNNLRASIDIGSNSTLLLAAEVGSDLKVVANESRVTGLGRDLDKNGEFLEVAMKETFKALEEYAEICEGLKIDKERILITATEASRVSKNAKVFFESIYTKLGLKVTVINGEGEAYYSAKGILFDKTISEDELVLMDIGGASTELVKVNTEESIVLNSFSMPIGVVRINNWKEDGVDQKSSNRIFSQFEKKLQDMRSKKLFCVAGTMTSIGNIFLGNKTFIEDEVNGIKLSVSEFVELYEKYKNYSAMEFLEKFPFLGKRSKTIHSGFFLANQIFKILNIEEIIISTYGLRYGTLIEGNIKEEYVW